MLQNGRPANQDDELARSARWICLAIILAIGVGLRAFRLSWGLPEYIFPDDQIHFLEPAARLVGAGDFALSGSQLFHPPVLVYAVGSLIWAWSLITGQPVHFEGPGLQAQLPTFMLLGRSLCVLVSLLLIIVLYVFARRLAGTRAALLAAAALAMNPILTLEAHRIHPETTMILIALVAAHQAAVASERRNRLHLLAAFAVAGFAGAAKYTGLAAVTVPMWIALSWPNSRWKNRFGFLILGGCATVTGFAFGMAPVLSDPSRLVEAFRVLGKYGYVVGTPGTGVNAQGWMYVRYLYPIVVVLPYVVGWGVYLAALAAVVILLRSRSRASGILAAATLPFFAVQGGAMAEIPRYFLFLAPYLALAAGITLARVWTYSRRGGLVISGAVLGYTFLFTASYCLRLGLGPQTAVAELIGKGAALRASAGKPVIVGYSDPLLFWYDAVRPKIKQPGMKVVYLPAAYQYSKLQVPDPPAVGDAVQRDLQWVRNTGIDVIVLPEWFELAVLRDRPNGEIAAFYRRLADGTLGFHLAADYRTHYISEGLYVWSEPMFYTYWETAISGYKVFVRDHANPAPARPLQAVR